jgi:hypothetical protein
MSSLHDRRAIEGTQPAGPGQILISPRVLMAIEEAVTVELVGEFVLKGIRRSLAAYMCSLLHHQKFNSRLLLAIQRLQNRDGEVRIGEGRSYQTGFNDPKNWNS